MAKERNWQSLSPAYRARLQRGGITRRQYERGASLSKARGHSKTPERPERAKRNPARYPDYAVREAVREQARKGMSDSGMRKWLKRYGDAHGIDDILSVIKPADRASFIEGWKIANQESYRGVSSFARMRMDSIIAEYEDEAGLFQAKLLSYYHSF